MNKSFEDQWKDALGDASQTPPPEIWERVEAELDRKKSRFFLWIPPVWRNRAVLSGVAAAITLALGTLFWVNYTATEREVSQKAGNPTVKQTERPEPAKTSPAVAEESLPASNPAAQQIMGRSQGDQASGAAPALHLAGNRIPAQGNREQVLQADNTPDQPLMENREQTLLPVDTPEQPVKRNRLTAAFDLLEALPFRTNQVQYPRVQVTADYVPANRQVAKKEKKGWMGVIAANAPFNPNFSTPGFQQQALMAIQNSNALLPFDKGSSGTNGQGFYSNTSRTDAESSFKRGQSMSLGFIFGRKLKKRLSLESGLKFTRATVTHTSNVYAVNAATGVTESFSYANYMSSSGKISDVLISVNGTSHYSYHFLSVPLLLNYEVLNIGKLNVSAVGGVSSEFLLSGTVVNSRQEEQNFNAGNSNFRPVNIAGTGGLRISYPVTSVLDINLGGMYQHFLTSGLQNGTNATFRPSTLGISLGLSVRH
ncbi:MAG: PorT family protein [Leadbetterella sp.]|nr:PorT family protein [Leadbetterella sp.]